MPEQQAKYLMNTLNQNKENLAPTKINTTESFHEYWSSFWHSYLLISKWNGAYTCIYFIA